MGWGENDRGVSFTFGAEVRSLKTFGIPSDNVIFLKVVAKFLHKHDFDLICRAHQV